MTAVIAGPSISVYEMLKTVGRAGVVTKTGSAEEITTYLQSLGPEELVEEFHRAVVILSERGLLTPQEKVQMAQYAKDWVRSQPMGV